jgi:S-adenosylmethionine:tRNA ribosyltransferase-isomerase
LADYQTVYGRQPGSAEMASAGRPFTAPLLVRLMASGVTLAPVVLHAGVSSPELHEPPAPARFEVPESIARLVRSARDAGHRVVAVGTTVVRALETATRPGGLIGPAHG